jgi:AAA domain
LRIDISASFYFSLMPTNREHYRNIVQFWRSTEIFTLPDIPAEKRNDRKTYTELQPNEPLPWEDGAFPVPAEGRQWKHTLYFHVVAKEAVMELLATLCRSTEFREPVFGRTCLSALVLNQQGEPAERSYSPAAFVYGIKILREKLDPEELTELLHKAQEDYLERFQVPKRSAGNGGAADHGKEGTAGNGGASGHGREESAGHENGEAAGPKRVDRAMLRKELELLRGLVQRKLTASTPVLCVSEQVNVPATFEAPFLNSYYLNDLNTLISSSAEPGRPLEILLRPEVDAGTRTNLLQHRPLLESLHPRHLAAGRWPSHPAHGLYSAQQAALNITLASLQPSSGLLGINGPPGTGKTTLLREVIANVIVNRAERLLKVDVERLFAADRTTIIDALAYYPIHRTVAGNDGIVVSSNNNTAIENISKELPVLRSIHGETFAEADYFSAQATVLYGEPCWGMLSATLGKAENRSSFVSALWYAPNSFRGFLREQYDDPVQRAHNKESYSSTARELTALLKEYAEFRALAVAYHDALLREMDHAGEGGGGGSPLQVLGARLVNDWGILPANLPDGHFMDLSATAIQRLMPYSSERVNTLRSEIFLRSLELHEWAIRVNARKMSVNLNAFVNMISYKHPAAFKEEITAELWNTLFFFIPVVAVTLASFPRQFAKMGQGSIGWLLLDEAGQATPAAACGAIWRSQRCIVIGDTLQIQPVVTLPAALGKLLQQMYHIKDDCWTPPDNSVQSLADRVTPWGTYIQLEEGKPTWTGIPLRAHRRCSEPMFSLSNTIAYNGQMVRVMADMPADILTGDSGWIDVGTGTVYEGHAIVEELQVLADLLAQLTLYSGKIFVISPFRSIAEICKREHNDHGHVECGTIHTFQGKEADVVILVLGTHPGDETARNWVASSPNMLNVAITRAQKRLYVIGNRKVWSRHTLFGYMAKELPVKEHFSGRLF